MDHTYIDENSLIDRYVRTTLPVVEQAAFEEHFVDCPRCLEQLGIARSLREALRSFAASSSFSCNSTVPPAGCRSSYKAATAAS